LGGLTGKGIKVRDEGFAVIRPLPPVLLYITVIDTSPLEFAGCSVTVPVQGKVQQLVLLIRKRSVSGVVKLVSLVTLTQNGLAVIEYVMLLLVDDVTEID